MMIPPMAEPYLFDYRRTSLHDFKEVFHAHPEMEFTYVHEGEGNLILEGRTYAISPGTLLMFHPFQLHRIRMDVAPGRPFVRTLLIFDPAVLQPYWSQFPALKEFFQSLKLSQPVSPPLCLAPGDPAVSLLTQFHDTLPQLAPHETQEEYAFLLLGFLRQLRRFRQPAAGPAAPASRCSHRAEEIMQWIQRHYADPFELERLARELHISRYHAAHLFKEATGTTILSYVHATRVRHACVLLRQTLLAIPEIGIRTGYPNPSYFCRVFREAMGTTPHQYRLRVQK
ncbi:helix-turn-helix domain-containing protein [Paenibacillus caseinilyticus]|uniref:AraC family transcriptional regulator n=1 Tax=Paenibacillus mucilaginosus K02 TaxID=997761 RepID=I0BH51_9BACL|nr:AraC family transcriptional regulator [Paenibacillus mucilaginosus]AFH61698.2 AraC family transcriptional regulator [Paenibacillus mucilaginosus K02]